MGTSEGAIKGWETRRRGAPKIDKISFRGKEIDLKKLNYFSDNEIEKLIASSPKKISLKDGLEILYKKVNIDVQRKDNQTVSFDFNKLIGEDSHLQGDHNDSDFDRRMMHLLYAIDTARTATPRAEGLKRYKYIKYYPKDNFYMHVICDEKGDVREVFTYYTGKK